MTVERSHRPVLLTVSGDVPPDLEASVQEGRRPRADYSVMQRHFDADLVDRRTALAACGRIGRVIDRLVGIGPVLAWYCFRRRSRYEVIVTDGEQVGLPYAVLCRLAGSRRARHVMIVHRITTTSKTWLIRLTRCASSIDRWVVYSSNQRDQIAELHHVPDEHLVLTTFMVDSAFFDPERPDPSDRRDDGAPIISSAGLERRDYPTLVRAVDGLEARVVIAAASPWARQPEFSPDGAQPSNVSVCRLDHFELRALYARSRLVVVPLLDVDFQAGITTILEAMAMGLPVIVTRTPGQTDTVRDGATGLYVPPGDPAALRTEIERFLSDDHRRITMGAAARAWVVENADVEVYAERLAGVVDSLRSEARSAS